MRAIVSILHKDLLVLWPIALFTAVLLAARPFAAGSQYELIQIFIPIFSFLATAILVIAVGHQDAAASVRHDWLTRPIARRDLLFAKLLFLILTVLLPLMLGNLSQGLIAGYSVGEAYARATQLDTNLWMIVIGGIAIASVTSTFIEAAGAAMAVAVTVVVALSVLLMIGLGEAAIFTGVSWIITTVLYVLLLAVVGTAMWLQYARRNTTAARLTLAVAGIAALMVAYLLPWPLVFGIQKALAARAPEVADFQLALAPDCFPTTIVDLGNGAEGPQYTNPNYTEARAMIAWSDDERAAVGMNAISFLSIVRMRGVPDGWRPFVSHLTARVMTPTGGEITSLQPGRATAIWGVPVDGDRKAVHAFLVSRPQYDAWMAAGAHIELDYSLTLLRPTKTFEFAADGTRSSIPGVGYCGAAPTPRTLMLSCFTNRMQPAMLTAQVVGAPGDGEPVDLPDFRPALLSFLADIDHRGRAPIGAERIRVTTFDDAAHFDRSISIPGLLNGKDSRPAE